MDMVFPFLEMLRSQMIILSLAMATFSSTLAWRIPWTEEPGGLQSMGSQESDTTERLTHSVPISRDAQMTILSLARPY